MVEKDITFHRSGRLESFPSQDVLLSQHENRLSSPKRVFEKALLDKVFGFYFFLRILAPPSPGACTVFLEILDHIFCAAPSRRLFSI